MTKSITPKFFSMNSIIANYVSWKPYSSENCNHRSITRAHAGINRTLKLFTFPASIVTILPPPPPCFHSHCTYNLYRHCHQANCTHFNANCTHYQASCIHYRANCTCKAIHLPGSDPQLLIIYSLTSHEITQTFTSPEDNLSKSKR